MLKTKYCHHATSSEKPDEITKQFGGLNSKALNSNKLWIFFPVIFTFKTLNVTYPLHFFKTPKYNEN